MRLWLLFSIAYPLLVAAAIGLGSVFPGDEGHFLETSRLFAQKLSWEWIRTYPEMSGPLPFLVFAGWGSVFGWSLPVMRTCSLLIGAVAMFVAGLVFRDAKQPLWAAGLLGLNPYWAAMTVFVYTDMLTVLCALLAYRMAVQQRAVLYALAMAGALVSRQYLVYMALAVALWFAWRRAWPMVAATLAAMLPLGALVLLWGALAPASNVRGMYLAGGFQFHTGALVGYIGVLFVFLMPWLIWRKPTWSWWPLALGFAIYWISPVRTSPPSLAAGILTTGLLDRALHLIMPAQFGRDLFWAVCFGAGLSLLWSWRQRRTELAVITVLCFLAVMPVSYLYWEKYLLPVLPLAALVCSRPVESRG
ncbi:MAG: hypothetical protein JNK87_35045 [Bryobacterales bacterium]|nr:hypothetical protein [Bryobacterales bacterium]